MAVLSVNIAGVEFPIPVIAASGTYGNGECFTDLYPLSRRRFPALYRAPASRSY